MSFSDIDPDRLPIIGEELLDSFQIGDLVRWVHDLRTEKAGIVLEIYTERMANRMFPYAKIYIMGEDKYEALLLSSLTKISKK
jgi:hypothetical protein